jgi:hypothetical protein
VASSKVRTDALAKAQAEAKQREEKAVRARAELAAANAAAKYRPDTGTKDMAEAMLNLAANEVARVHNLEIENEALKKLLSEAYMEIALLKNSLGGR